MTFTRSLLDLPFPAGPEIRRGPELPSCIEEQYP